MFHHVSCKLALKNSFKGTFHNQIFVSEIVNKKFISNRPPHINIDCLHGAIQFYLFANEIVLHQLPIAFQIRPGH